LINRLIGEFQMSKTEGISIVIPSFNPSDTLVRIAGELVDAGIGDIIVVNDGSDAGHIKPFEAVEKLPGCTVLTHTQNMGKGASLKTAFAFFMENRPDKTGVVTMDSDGQHLTADVVRCAEILAVPGETVIMGVRDFKRPGVPCRNSYGNRLTAFAFRVILGIKLHDTQTGLRGIRAMHMPVMLKTPGNRFEYETNMLLAVEKSGIEFQEVDIETVYEEGSGERSYYRPLADSMAILSRLFKFVMSSFLSFLLDVGIFWITIRLFGALLGAWAIPACTVFARIWSSFFNFYTNRRIVFMRSHSFSRQMLHYYLLAAVNMILSASLLWLVADLLSAGYAAGTLALLKVIVDITLFFLNYYVQRKWVFRNK